MTTSRHIESILAMWTVWTDTAYRGALLQYMLICSDYKQYEPAQCTAMHSNAQQYTVIHIPWCMRQTDTIERDIWRYILTTCTNAICRDTFWPRGNIWHLFWQCEQYESMQHIVTHTNHMGNIRDLTWQYVAIYSETHTENVDSTDWHRIS